jgi:uncharacterized protein YegJ (DUF2314 family)
MKNFAFASVVACVAVSWTTKGYAEDPVMPFATDDPAMNAAIADAQKTLPLFLAHAFADDGTSLADTLVKVGLPAVNGPNSLEHIWVMPFTQLTETEFSGILANEPDDLGDLGIGDTVEFTLSQISDWSMTSEQGLYWGNYTTRVMFDYGAFEDAPFDTVFEASPLPPSWN